MMSLKLMRWKSFAPNMGLAALALGALCAPLARAAVEEPALLRICADPSNPPFSSDDANNPGVDVEIGKALGRALGRPVSFVWYRTYFGGRAVRVTMLSKQCEATIGLPADKAFMGPRVIFSKPLYNLGYAVILPADRNFTGLDDLKGLRVAVQFSTAPQSALARRDEVTAVTVMSPEEGMQALASGRADAAFIWGPSAGYLNQSAYKNAYKIVSVEGPGYSWPAAVGFPKSQAELRDSVDAAMPRLSAEVAAIAAKYGFPSGPQVQLAAWDAPVPVVAAAARSDASAAASPKPAEAAGAAPPVRVADEAAPSEGGPKLPPSTPEAIADGKEVFNGTCAHCHGPDGVQSDKHIDLRRLHLRYGADMLTVYWKTVHEGRPSKGMPTWGGIFNDEQIADIYDYLETLQSKD
jgi:ABC-type amino acid transport substrate-binding protein/cytochrome c553